MYNDLFSIGNYTVHSYGLCIAVGVILALVLSEWQAKKRGMNVDALYSLTFICVLFGFIGAKIVYVIVEWDSFIQDPMSFFSMNGFVVYGGIIGGILAAMVYLNLKKLYFLDYFDIVMPAVAVAQGFGRIGCFMAGCCYGRATDSFIGIAFTDSHFAPNHVKLIPTQLFSAVGLLLIAAGLYIFLEKKKTDKPGQAAAYYMIVYSIARAVIEEFRADKRGAIGFLSTSQFISIFVVLFGIGFLLTRKERKKTEEIQDEGL